MSHPIRCPKCRRTYLQFRCIGAHIVLNHSGATLLVDIKEFVCSCGHAFVPVPVPSPSVEMREEREAAAA